MPIPPFSIQINPKGISDFSVDLIQAPYPTETFEADKNGMFQIIPALAARARQSDIQPLLTPSVIASQTQSSPIPPSTWTTLTFDNIQNINNEFAISLSSNFLLLPPYVAYYRFNMKVVVGGLALGDTVLLRLLAFGSTPLAQNQVTSSGTTQVELFLDKKYLFYFNDYFIFQVYTDALTATIDGSSMVSNDNYLELSR